MFFLHGFQMSSKSVMNQAKEGRPVPCGGLLSCNGSRCEIERHIFCAARLEMLGSAQRDKPELRKVMESPKRHAPDGRKLGPHQQLCSVFGSAGCSH